jgi:feruloyl esterase
MSRLQRRVLVMAAAVAPLAFTAGLRGLPAQAAPAGPARSCSALTQLRWPGVEITSARVVPAAAPGTVRYNTFTKLTIPVALPEYCRVEGMIDRRKGANGVEYGIGFAIALPSNWNGRLLYQGGGAFNGSVQDPYGADNALDDPALARGFAVVSTDSGHKGEPFNTTFYKDQQASLDFALNAVPTVTRTGRDLAAAYFGRAPHHTYADGCSTGGREGMLGAERFPTLFDGVVSGDPAMRSWNTRIAGWNATVAFNLIAPKDAQGQPLKPQAFPAEDQKLLYAAVAEQCDALDGLKDGLILNIAACKFDPEVLECKASETQGCLSAEKVAALKRAFGATKDSRGYVVYPGFPYDLAALGSSIGNATSRIPPTALNPYDTPPTPYALDVDALLEQARNDHVEALTDTAGWEDLGSFYRRGGKVIFYHGASDPWYAMNDTLDYVQRNKAANPDFDSIRFYSVPGMAHCGDGGLERFDMLTAIVDWVENGKAPGQIIATDWLRKTRRPLCPWPQYGRYKGAGDPNDAANFECRTD